MLFGLQPDLDLFPHPGEPVNGTLQAESELEAVPLKEGDAGGGLFQAGESLAHLVEVILRHVIFLSRLA
jgi:hypothetical protein